MRRGGTQGAGRLALAAVAALAGAALLAGCGGGADAPSAPPERSSRLVDLSQKEPRVNAFDIDPADGAFLLTTNRGFWRIDRRTGAVRRVEGTMTAGGGRAPVGRFLDLTVTGPGKLLGSGHPDGGTGLPSFLGLIRSDDGGRTWTSVSRLGDADLHKLIRKHDRLYAFDAVLGAMLVSQDGGRTFREEFTPRGLITDFEVDPADPDVLLAATEDRLFRSEDGGKAWRPAATAPGIRVAWPAPGRLYRAQADGAVQRSADGGRTWEEAGTVPGSPAQFEAVSADELYLALGDGEIVHTTDAGATWRSVFTP